MPALVKLLAAAAPAAEPDADLLARFVAARDDAAFAELVRRHGPAVYGTCRRLVGPAAADDAFQATFLVLAARAGSVRKAASVGSWLVGVAGRVSRRMRLRDRRQETGDTDRSEPVCSLSPDSCLLSHELGATLAEEFTRLPDRLRAAAVACLVDGHTQEQAAAVLGWSSRTVRRRLDEAKGLLRTRLERRGVTPAVAAAAVAAAGEAAALPAGLARRATDAATLFLAGGGADARAAALAHGVIGTMTTIRSTTAAAACAAVLVGLGIGWAGDTPPPAPKAALKADADRIPVPAAKGVSAAAGPHVHKTANFEVTAPTATMARALAEAYERQRSKSAVAWSGADLPAWKEPVPIRVRALPPGPSPYQVDASGRVPGDDDFVDGALGTQDTFVNWHAPMLADRLVVRTLLGRRPPWWAEGALDSIANPNSPPTFWTSSVVPVRRQLEAGEARRLAALFGANQQAGGSDAQTQGTTVVAFLLSLTADPRPGRPLTAAEVRRTLLRFLKAGSDSGWERAAKDVYGFTSLAEMERAWADWVRAEPGPAPDPDRIPAAGAPIQPSALKTPPAAHTHKTANFVVEAPTAAVARALGEEHERQRAEAARAWLGKELPAWKEPARIRVAFESKSGFYRGTLDFRVISGADLVPPIGGPLDVLLTQEAPYYGAHLVLTSHLGRRPPLWVELGLGDLTSPDADRLRDTCAAYRQLTAGEAYRLSALFKMADQQTAPAVLHQSRTVVRFLLTREPDRRAAVFEGGSIGRIDPPPPLAPGESAAKRGLLTFLEIAAGGRWEHAAKDVYGFASLAEMERAWAAWLRTQPGAESAAPAVAPDRIPPTELTTPRAEPEAANLAPCMVATKNFIVTATGGAAEVAEEAERLRRELARKWLGKVLTDGPPVFVYVENKLGANGGSTTFTFGEADGKRPPGVKSATMELRGPSHKAVLGSTLPHEVMHVVLATHFGRPLPRWADEGIAVLAESDAEQKNHDIRARELLNAGRAIRLSTLLRMTEYPQDSIVTFAQGYSVCRFLLARGAADPHPGGPPGERAHKTVRYARDAHEVRFAKGDREPALLAFLALGMYENSAASWATAAKEVYGFDSLDALEQAWIDSLRPTGAPVP